MNYFLVLLLSLVLVSCGGSSDSDNDQQLETKLILRDSFRQESDSFIQGENIEFLLTVTNNSSDPLTLNFLDGQQYDFYINSSIDTEVWRWSADKAFTQALTELVIQAGESIEISQVWNQTLAGGGVISIGNYFAFGSLLDQSPEAEFNFSIQ